jgi:tRNA 2-selenouridine synthase
VSALATLPARFHYRVVCGLTGSGKSRLLGGLAAEGAQVLDLEGLARHRGSLLGDLPSAPQPGQKWFESQLYDALTRLDAARPVYVESESKRIGTAQLPDSLLDAMRAAACLRVDTPLELRVALLKEEYAHFLDDRAALAVRLAHLVPLHGRKTVQRWSDLAAGGNFDSLVGELLDTHYDPLYLRSIERNFPRYGEAYVAHVEGIDEPALRTLARAILASEPSRADADLMTSDR